MSNETNIRLNRLMAMAGICSRRDADELIKSGKVTVGGRVITDLGARFPINSVIHLLGDTKPRCFNVGMRRRVWVYNKPRGLVVSHRDELGRRTVFDELRNVISERIVSIGRLDLQSQGLMILTNDSSLVFQAQGKQYERVYDVKLYGALDQKTIISKTKKPITIDGITYNIAVSNINKNSDTQTWVRCHLNEGKNREIRRVFEYFGVIVTKLIRVRYGPYDLGDLGIGCVREVDDLF